jgi:hypothetical protein
MRYMIFGSLLTISSVLAVINSTSAQTTDPRLNALINPVNLGSYVQPFKTPVTQSVNNANLYNQIQSVNRGVYAQPVVTPVTQYRNSYLPAPYNSVFSPTDPSTSILQQAFQQNSAAWNQMNSKSIPIERQNYQTQLNNLSPVNRMNVVNQNYNNAINGIKLNSYTPSTLGY